MKNIFNGQLLIIIILSIILIILLFNVLQICSYLKTTKRLKNFTLDKREDTSSSLIDDILKIFWNFIKKVSIVFKRSKFFKNYADSLDKYLIYDNEKKLTSFDYITIKFIIMILIQILYVISIFIKYLPFNILTLLIASIISFMSVDVVIIYNFNNRKKLIEEQLLQAVVIMNSAFKSGKNIHGAIEIVKNELSSPIKEEFEIVSKDLNYGLDLASAFDRFSKRVKVEEAKYITSSLSLLNKTGGNIVTVFNMIERNFYEKIKVKNELKALTSSSKYMYRLLLAMPIIFIAIILLLNPSYFSPLITTTIGKIISLIIITLYIIYIFIIKKVMKVGEV